MKGLGIWTSPPQTERANSSRGKALNSVKFQFSLFYFVSTHSH